MNKTQGSLHDFIQNRSHMMDELLKIGIQTTRPPGITVSSPMDRMLLFLPLP